MRRFFTLLLIGFSITVQAQDNGNTLLQPATSIHNYYNPAMQHRYAGTRYEVNALGDLYLGATTLPTAFASKFFFGGDIDTELKDKASDKLNSSNKAGYDLSNGIWFSSTLGNPDSSRLRLHVGVESNTHLATAYTEDLFRIAFYGNSIYADETAVFDNSRYDAKSYISYKVAASSLFEIGDATLSGAVGIGILEGTSGNELDITSGSMYTSPDGTFIDLDYDFTFNTTGSRATKISDPRGLAIGADIYLSYATADQSWLINFAMADLGAFTWNDEDNALFSGDTASRYEGIDVTNIILGTNEAALGNEDLLLSYVNLDSTYGNFSTLAPTRLDLNATRFISDLELYVSGGVHMRLGTEYQPLMYVRGGKRLPDGRSDVGAMVSVGGYGGFGVGGSYSRRMGEHLQVLVSSPSILGFVAPTVFTTAALQLGVRAAF